MTILMMTVPMAILLGAGFVGAFIWATSKGQFDDTETPAHRILVDETERGAEK
jgi:cbb3-type cytochrome oxidase maturation protein